MTRTTPPDRIAELERDLAVTRYTVVRPILGHGIAARSGDVLMHAPTDTILPLAVLRFDGDEWRTVAHSTAPADIAGWLQAGVIARRVPAHYVGGQSLER